MRRFPRPSAYQVADSVLLGLAAAAILAVIVHLVRDKTGFLDLRVYLLLLGVGFVAGVVALGIGLGRGRDTVDGVFIGPTIRSLSILCVFCAIGLIPLIEEPTPPRICDNGTVVSLLDECPPPNNDERCASAKVALTRKLEEAISLGTFGALEAGPKGNLLQAARSVNRTCPSEEAGAALDDLRSYRDSDPADEPTKTADEKTVAYVSIAVQGPVDEDRVVIGQPAPGNPPTVQVTVSEPIIPTVPTPDPGEPEPDPDPGEPEPNQAPQRTVTREYKLGLLPEILNQVLGGIGFGFGGVKVTTKEIQSALENEDVVEGGQTLADSTAPLETASRAQLYWALIQVVKLDASVGGADVETMASALKVDHALAMCFLILSQTTDNENFDFIREMEGVIVNNFAAVRHDLKEEVESCINELIGDQATFNAAQQEFAELMGAYDE
ncbi:hypothetical protein [uncultured Roseibium sp.]|uniref:hypothetical protein n=1 Tax=uncultured Roseibium sp. TaxID=1936171 RepID=UPI00261316E8|nr:hypothetical protein [uncultured Roseibium sp.]